MRCIYVVDLYSIHIALSWKQNKCVSKARKYPYNSLNIPSLQNFSGDVAPKSSLSVVEWQLHQSVEKHLYLWPEHHVHNVVPHVTIGQFTTSG